MAIASNFCEIIKSKLDLGVRTRVGLLESLTSPLNVTSGSFEPRQNILVGKKKTQLVRYMQPALTSDGTSGVLGVGADPTYCGGTAVAYREQQFPVNNWAQQKAKINNMDVASFCEGKGTVIADTIGKLLDALLVDINEQLIASFDALRGNTSLGNTTPISARAFSDYANLVASPAISDSIKSELFDLKKASAVPIVVGGSLLLKYANAAGIGCCNNFGQQVNEFTGDVALYLDNTMNASNLGVAPANNDWFVYPAGTVQFLDWSLAANATISLGDSPFSSSTQLSIPVGGDSEFMVDLKVTYDDCAEEWTITLTKFFGLMTVPADYFQVGDPLSGVNYMLRFRPTTV
jgi:hypothetical protein